VASPAAAVLESSDDRAARRSRSACRCAATATARSPRRGPDGEWSGDDDPLSDHGREDEDVDVI